MQTIEDLLSLYKTRKYKILADGGISLRLGRQLLQFKWNSENNQYVMVDIKSDHYMKNKNKRRKK